MTRRSGVVVTVTDALTATLLFGSAMALLCLRFATSKGLRTLVA